MQENEPSAAIDVADNHRKGLRALSSFLAPNTVIARSEATWRSSSWACAGTGLPRSARNDEVGRNDGVGEANVGACGLFGRFFWCFVNQRTTIATDGGIERSPIMFLNGKQSFFNWKHFVRL
jgi:hypothetical protein